MEALDRPPQRVERTGGFRGEVVLLVQQQLGVPQDRGEWCPEVVVHGLGQGPVQLPAGGGHQAGDVCHDGPRALPLAVEVHDRRGVDAKVTDRLSRSSHGDDDVIDDLPARGPHDRHFMRLKEKGAALAVEMEHLRHRLGRHGRERSLQQLLQARTEHRQSAGPVHDRHGEPRATHQRLERGWIDRGDRGGEVVLGHHHAASCLRCGSGSSPSQWLWPPGTGTAGPPTVLARPKRPRRALHDRAGSAVRLSSGSAGCSGLPS